MTAAVRPDLGVIRYGRGAEHGAYALSTLLMAVSLVVLIVQVALDARRAPATDEVGQGDGKET